MLHNWIEYFTVGITMYINSKYKTCCIVVTP